jgi:hypothetical protein
MPVLIPPDDPVIAHYVAHARRAAATPTGQLAYLRRIVLAEAALRENRSARRILVAAGQAAWLVLLSHGVRETRATVRASRVVRELQGAIDKARADRFAHSSGLSASRRSGGTAASSISNAVVRNGQRGA